MASDNRGKLCTPEEILAIARGEIGVLENPKNSNKVKYNTEYYGRAVSGSAYPWCCAFVWWVFKQAGASSLFYGGKKTAHCATLMSYHKKQKVTDYRPGDIIFFNFAGGAAAKHVGICETYNGSTITTIDGNTGVGNEANGGAVMRRTRDKKYIVGAYRPDYASVSVSPPKGDFMKYTVKNGIHIVEVPVTDFKIDMCDAKKKSAAQKNFCNAGFFATYDRGAFTLPVAHLTCDYSATNTNTKKYCTERGNFDGNKFSFDSSKWSYMNEFCGHAVSTLMICGTSAWISDIKVLPADVDYAISGVPIMQNGQDVKYDPYVIGQGWDGSPMRATWHTFVGLKRGESKIYVMGMKTTTSNMIKTAEAYKKFKAIGMTDVIKLDGGGSFHFNVDGKAVASTSENRRINTIIHFDSAKTSSATATNPYKEPSVVLKKGNLHKEGNRWLQWQLTAAGYTCAIDGGFGSETLTQVKKFQKDYGLEVDGKVGPATRSALKNAI